MKKVIVALLVISLLYLSGVYWIGVVAERETIKMFALNEQQGLSGKLINYKRSFFTATSESEVKMVTDGDAEIAIKITSNIQHYPYKAVIKNKLTVNDVQLNKRLVEYFGRQDWLESEDEITIFGQLSGRLMLPAGHFYSDKEQFSNQPLRLDYQLNLNDYSGIFDVTLAGVKSRTPLAEVALNAIQLSSNFTLLAASDKYEYLVKVADMAIKQPNRSIYVESLKLQGSTYLSNQGENINSNNEWVMGLYQTDQTNNNAFTDSRIKVNVTGLSAAVFSRLSHERASEQEIALTISDLFAYGLQLKIVDLSSQTPWGSVDGALDLTLHKGAVLTEVLGNPFMLLDYVTGSVNLQLPEKLLQQRDMEPLLRAALQAGFLREEGQSLHFQTQLQLGELTVNGRNIPL